MSIPSINFIVILPILILIGTGLIVLLLDLFLREAQRTLNLYLSLAGVAGAAVAAGAQLMVLGGTRDTLEGMAIFDTFGLVMQWLLLAIAAFGLVFSADYLKQHKLDRGEFYVLMLFVTAGGLVMATSNDLIMIFLGLEILSIALYILSAFARERATSGEAGMKYLLLGGFASAFLLYGIALTFGATGHTNLDNIATALAPWARARAERKADVLPMVGLGLMLIGFGFKVAAAPFHSWVPDVYEGAPTPVSAFMSAATKVASFAALMRILAVAFPLMWLDWGNALALLAILTMTVGNVAALMQTNIKRMLAYSGIAHAGYIMVALAAGFTVPAGQSGMSGFQAAVFYLVVYTLMNLGAWMVVLAMGHQGQERLEINDFAGLHARSPLLALAMLVFMLALAGMPPTGGLMGKWLVFSAAVQQNLVMLALIGVLNSVVSLGYYLRVVGLMYTRPADTSFSLPPLSRALAAAIVIALIGVVVLGVYPTLTLEWMQSAGLLAIR